VSSEGFFGIVVGEVASMSIIPLAVVTWVAVLLSRSTTPAAPVGSQAGDRSGSRTSYQDKFVNVGGLRVHYLDWGGSGKRPLIMLHGIARTAHSFDHIAPQFNTSYHVIAMDLRGHGDSAWSTEGAYLVEDYVKDLEALLDHLNLRNVVLLGNSTGGRVAQVYAGIHPDRVASLIVEDVGPERPADVADNFARRVQAEANGWASEDELVASLMASDKRTAEALQRNYARFGAKRRADGRLIWKRDPNLVRGFVPTDLWQYVRKITCPAIYILGGSSTIVPPTTQQQLKETLPNAQVVVLPDVGHYPHQEVPDAYVKIVRDFLAGSKARPHR
jgi:pimeloyl-ACP methyl ester carboxylesterase